jgi:hypothetical protein
VWARDWGYKYEWLRPCSVEVVKGTSEQ